MAEETPGQMAQLPPLQPASKMAVLVSGTDVTLYLGSNKAAFSPNGELVGQNVLYYSGYALSPGAAKQLGMMLTNAVSEYEKMIGPIAMDPDFEKKSQIQEVKSTK